MDFSKLFKLGDKNILEDTKEVNLEGKENKEVRKIILDNFPKLFPHLELYNEGNEYTLPIFKKNKRPDSLAYCESEKRLYIFEYKSKIDEELIKQVREYRDGLQKKDSSLYELILKWNKQFNKQRGLKDFKENKAKIICISPEFDDYAIGVEEEWEEEIYLIKITKYKDKKGVFFVSLQSRNLEMFNSVVNIEDDIRELSKPLWLDKLKQWVSKEIEPLAANNNWFLKGRRGASGWDMGKINQGAVLSICFRSQFNYFTKPRVFFVNPANFLIKEWKLEGPNQWGSHFYPVEKTNDDCLSKAKQLITEFIKERS